MSNEEIQPESETVEIAERIVTQNDEDRLQSMCSLLNTFNYAVQVQSSRNQWNARDFRAFCIALVAMDQIGQGMTTQQAYANVDSAVQSLASRRLRETQ